MSEVMEQVAVVEAKQNEEEMVQMNTLSSDEREVKTMGRKTLPWSAGNLTKKMDNGTAVFDNAVQRTLVWTKEQKSLLIHSMIIGAAIPPLYCNEIKDEDKGNIYSFLDGKQRSNAIHDYIKEEYALVDVPMVEFTDRTEIDINGLKFSELSPDMQDNIKNYSLSISVFEDLNDDEMADMFYRLNHGSTLSAIEISRVKAKDIYEIQDLAKHDVFKEALTPKAIAKYTNEDLVIKSHIMLYSSEKNLTTKFVRPYTENLDITEEQATEMNKIYDLMLRTHEAILTDDTLYYKDAKKIAKRLLTKTHFLSIMPLAQHIVRGGATEYDFKEFVEKFFNGLKKVSINDTYNDRCGSGVAYAENVTTRINIIQQEWNTMMEERNATEEGVVETEDDEQ